MGVRVISFPPASCLLLAGFIFAGCQHHTNPRPSVSIRNVPKTIERITHHQIAAYFPDGDVRGVPLLDPAIDWTVLKNWPDQFVWRGKSYHARFKSVDFDFAIPVKARAALRPGWQIWLSYDRDGTNSFASQSIHVFSAWNNPDSIYALALNSTRMTNQVFYYEFFPTGQLSRHGRRDFTTREMIYNYYDQAGNLRGSISDGGDPFRKEWLCKWDGRELDYKTLQVEFGKLFDKSPTPKN